MDVLQTDFDNCVVLGIKGSLDATTQENLLNHISAVIGKGTPNIILDFSEVSFLSSAGLRALIISSKECRINQGDLRIAEISDRICKVLDLGGFTSFIQLFGTVDEAIQSFRI